MESLRVEYRSLVVTEEELQNFPVNSNIIRYYGNIDDRQYFIMAQNKRIAYYIMVNSFVIAKS